MKKYVIGILMLGVLLFALCGCGGSPLAKAYDSLTALSQGESDGGTSEYVEAPLEVQYDEGTETLFIDIQNGTDLDPIFEALNEAVDGKDIGTLIFGLSGTKGDDYEKALVKKIGDLPCSSLERLGLNYPILDYSDHSWLALADKTDKLYLDTNCSVFYDYSDADVKKLAAFKDVQYAYEPDMRLGGISRFKGMETFSFVPGFEIESTGTEEAEDPLAEVTEDNPYLNGESGDTENAVLEQSEEADTEEDAEGAPALIPFDYYSYGSSSSGIEDLARLESLKTLLILPDTGYELTTGGQSFIKSLQYLTPELQVNPPGEAGSEKVVAVTDIKTPDLTEEDAADILAGFLDENVEDVYNTCKKYEKADGDAVLKGKSLIYVADPAEEDWSDKKVYSSIGDVKILEPEKKGIKVPEAVGDFETFVYIYPTYKRTGVYTSGTKAYSQTLNVQVFNMTDKVAYSAESVGTEPAPQSFSYFAGSVPDKHSGEVNIEKAYDYLAGLKTK
ncbi:MAG: hypothetical protein ACSW8G_00560 [Bacillota bacterium]